MKTSSSSHGLHLPGSSLCTPYLLLVPLGLLAVLLVLPSLGSSNARSGDLGVLCRGADAYSSNRGGGGYAVVASGADEAKEAPPRPDVARVDVRFVFCNVTDPVDAALLALEIKRHGDVLVLNCTENMNDGKTHEYLSSVPRIFASTPYDYVMKTDDDTYLRVAALAEELRTKPRDDVYLGHGFAVGDDPMQFMHGMGYVVSWDVAQWVSTNQEILRYNDTHGPEDLLVGKWLNIGKRGKNRYSLKPRMYDLDWFMDNFQPDTVAVHMLKDNKRWAATFRYFNVTAGLQPSNLYHLP
ncbi:hypothetical protein PR202_ga15824 [Eleusine coracana subsp. coracana]|uniref:Hexosyltransferase n=1 Tax=Eleusine coracana subsp. coracana TaxID=191504 RepID=A0AAV5CL64_ELECO|nr:hypothetical protein PR202_ga15824 [Eleusine coracana subsp. coracana]